MSAPPPLVSVVTPFHNEAPYLRECIASVVAQTWPRLEYILLDNASDDGSGEIAAECARHLLDGPSSSFTTPIPTSPSTKAATE